MKIDDLLALLPAEYEKACYDKKAITRKRTIKSPKDLIVLLFYYLFDNHSLIDTCQFALMSGIGKISDVALIERFVKCKEWIKWLIKSITPKEIINYKVPEELKDYNVIAVDASDITEKGAVRKTWHLHYAINLFTLNCNQFKITEETTGEKLKNFEIKKGDLIIADRAYGSISSIEYCMENKGDFILRIKNKPFNFYDKNGEKIILTEWLKNVGSEASDIILYFKGSDKKLKPIRICAVKKTKEEIEKAEKKLKRRDSKKQTVTSEDTKFSHSYVFVITSLPNTISAKKILEYYRLRWQVELVFKRYKSLLGMGSIPTKTKESGEIWLNGKMLIAMMIEQYLGDVDFSPFGRIRDEEEYLEGNETCVYLDFYDYTSR